MHAISSYRGNRPINKQTNKQTYLVCNFHHSQLQFTVEIQNKFTYLRQFFCFGEMCKIYRDHQFNVDWMLENLCLLTEELTTGTVFLITCVSCAVLGSFKTHLCLHSDYIYIYRHLRCSHVLTFSFSFFFVFLKVSNKITDIAPP